MKKQNTIFKKKERGQRNLYSPENISQKDSKKKVRNFSISKQGKRIINMREKNFKTQSGRSNIKLIEIPKREDREIDYV